MPLADGSGFVVKGVDKVFYFDAYGGWFDEFGNYYSAENVPSSPPPEKEEDYED